MEITKLKFKLIYLPFLFVLFSLIIVYTFLNWLLNLQLEIISINDNLSGIVIPALLSSILVYFIIRPRIELLEIKRPKRQYAYVFLFITGVFFPVHFAQNAIAGLTGQLYELEDASTITENKLKRFYRIDNYAVKRAEATNSASFVKNGRNGRKKFSMTVYFTAPLQESVRKENFSGIMFCQKYNKAINAPSKKTDEKKEFDWFFTAAFEQFRYNSIDKITYFRRITETSPDFPHFHNAACKFDSEITEWIFLSPEYTPFEKKGYNMLLYAIISLASSLSIIWFTISFTKIDPGKTESFRNIK